MKLLYIFPSRSRPEKLLACLKNIQDLATEPNYEIIVSMDVDDRTVAYESFNSKLKAFKNVRPVYGFSKNKVDAINRDVWMAKDWDVLILMSDDMVFLQKGFDTQITNTMLKNFPDMDGVLHYPDGSPAGNVLATMSIMGEAYYKRFNYIYHPDYANVYCDNEFTEVARKLNKYKFLPQQLFVHNHPVWKKTGWDEQYHKTEDKAGYARDHEVFQRRKKIKFDL